MRPNMSFSICFYCLFCIVASSSILFSSTYTWARKKVEIIDFKHKGKNCPPNSVGYVYDDMNNTMTIGFDQYAAYLANPADHQYANANCRLTFRVKVPNAVQVSINRVEYLGFLDTEPSVNGTLFRKYKYGNFKPVKKTDHFPSGYSDDFYIIDTFGGISKCSEHVNVSMDTSIELKGRPSGEYYNEMIVDSVSYDTRLIVFFELHSC